jgi:hypothetical protein
MDIKLVPFNSRGSVAIGDVTAITITPTGTRAAAPYPPGKVQVNGSYWPTSTTGTATLTWAHRIRTAQSGYAVVHQDAASTSGTLEGTYTVEVLINAVVIGARTQTGLTGTSYAYTYANRVTDDANAAHTVQFRITPVNGSISGTPRLTDAFLMAA